MGKGGRGEVEKHKHVCLQRRPPSITSGRGMSAARPLRLHGARSTSQIQRRHMTLPLLPPKGSEQILTLTDSCENLHTVFIGGDGWGEV